MMTRDRQVLCADALTLPGLALLGHSVSSRAANPLDIHIHPGCMEFVVLCRGTECYHVGGQRHELTGFDVFVSFVDQPHSTGSAPQGVNEIIWFQINPDAPGLLGLGAERAAVLRARLLALDTHRLRADRDGLWLLRRAFHGLLRRDPGEEPAAAALFTAFLLRLLAQPRPAPPHESMRRAQRYILENLNGPLPLEQVCRACGLSLSTLKHRFKECTGDAPRDFINHAKVERAKEMLAQGSSVTEVAMELGFGSPGYFSVVFKKYTAMTPSEWAASLSPAALRRLGDSEDIL